MTVVEDPEHSNGAPTVEDTGIRVKDIAVAYEHSGYDPTGSRSCIRIFRSGTFIASSPTTITSTSFGL